MADEQLQEGETIRTSKNGKFVVYNSEGAPVRIISPEAAKATMKIPSTLVPENIQDPMRRVQPMKPMTTTDRVAEFSRDFIAPLIKGSAQELGGTGGAALGAVGGVPGAVAGSVAGSGGAAAVYDWIAKNLNPKFLGGRNLDNRSVLDYGVEGAVDRAASAGFSAAQKFLVDKMIPGGSRTVEAIKRGGMKGGLATMIPGARSVSPEIGEAMKAESGFSTPLNPDAAQLTGRGISKTVRDLFGSENKLLAQQEAQKGALTTQANEMLSDVAGSPVSLQTGNYELTRGQQEAAGQRLSRMEQITNRASRAFDSVAKANTDSVTVPGKPTGEINQLTGRPVMAAPTKQTIEAPVTLNKSVQYAAQVSNRVNELIAEAQRSGIQMTGDQLKELVDMREVAQQILDAPISNTTGKKIIPNDIAKRIRNTSYKDESLQKFGKALYADFRDSMKTWSNADQAENLYNRSAGLFRQKNVMQNSTIGRAMREDLKNPENALNMALTNRTEAVRYLQNGGDKKAAATAFLRDAFTKGVNNKEPWNPGSIRKYLNENKEVWNTFATQEQRTNVEYLLKRMEIAEPQMSKSWRTALRVGAATGAAVIPAALMGDGFSNYSVAKSGVALGTFAMGRLLTNGALLDPTVSRTLVSLIQQPPNSGPAQQAMKKLLSHKALQGLRMIVTVPVGDGNENYEAEVKDGKIVPAQQP